MLGKALVAGRRLRAADPPLRQPRHHPGRRARPTKPVRGIPADVAWYAYACSQCGYCVDQCDQFYGRGWESQSPRGKWYWLREYMEGREKWNQSMVDTFLVCTTCELCNLRCSAALPIEPSWMKLRGKLIDDEKRMTFPPFEMMSAALARRGRHLGRLPQGPRRLVPRGPAGEARPGAPGRARLLRRLHRQLRGAGHRHGQRAPARRGRRRLHLPRREGDLLRHADAGRRQVGAVRAGHAAEHRQREGRRRRHGHHLLPGLRHDVAPRLPGVGREAGHRLRITAKHYSEIVAEKLAAGEFAFPDANGRAPRSRTRHLARLLPHRPRSAASTSRRAS